MRERDDLAELLVEGREFPEFVREGGKELALQAVEDRAQVEQSGTQLSEKAAALQAAKAQTRIDTITKILKSGVQAPKN